MMRFLRRLFGKELPYRHHEHSSDPYNQGKWSEVLTDAQKEVAHLSHLSHEEYARQLLRQYQRDKLTEHNLGRDWIKRTGKIKP